MGKSKALVILISLIAALCLSIEGVGSVYLTSNRLNSLSAALDNRQFVVLNENGIDYAVVTGALASNKFSNNDYQTIIGLFEGPFEVYDLSQDEPNLLSNEYLINDLVSKAITIMSFSILPSGSGWELHKTDHSNLRQTIDSHRKTIGTYLGEYRTISNESFRSSEILQILDVTQTALSLTLNLSLGGALTDLSSVMEIGDLLISSAQIQHLKSQMDYLIASLQDPEELKEIQPNGLLDGISTWLSAYENIDRFLTTVDLEKSLYAMYTLRDLSIAFGSEWLVEALNSGENGFLTTKAKEATRLSEGFKPSLLTLLKSILATDTRKAQQSGMKIAFNLEYQVMICEKLLVLLEQIEKELVANRSIPLEMMKEYARLMVSFRLIDANTLMMIRDYGKPECISLIHRLGVLLTRVFTEDKAEELNTLIDLSISEAVFLGKAIEASGPQYPKAIKLQTAAEGEVRAIFLEYPERGIVSDISTDDGFKIIKIPLNSVATSIFGKGLTWNGDRRIEKWEEGFISLYSPQKTIKFVRGGERTYYISQMSFDMRLYETARGFIVEYRDGSQEAYDQSGKLIEIKDSSAQWTIAYIGNRLSSIISNSGERLEISYNEHGLVKSIFSNKGKRIEYKYEDGWMQKAVGESGETLYRFDENGILSEIVFPDGEIVRVEPTSPVTKATYAASESVWPTDWPGNISSIQLERFTERIDYIVPPPPAKDPPLESSLAEVFDYAGIPLKELEKLTVEVSVKLTEKGNLYLASAEVKANYLGKTYFGFTQQEDYTQVMSAKVALRKLGLDLGRFITFTYYEIGGR